MAFTNGIQNTGFVHCSPNTPIALDLDRSGAVEKIPVSNFTFDFAGDGARMTSLHEWFGPQEGILIDTTTGIFDGIVTGEHLFGDQEGKYLHGFEKLAVLHDLDKNGVVAGDELQNLAIWIDANSNGVLDAGEQSTLEKNGIISLSVNHKNLVGQANMNDGTTVIMQDLLLAR